MATSLAHHEALIRGFFGFIEPWEKQLTASPHAALLAGREKTGFLREDLRHSGLDGDRIEALPRCTALPEFVSLPQVLGGLYVIEGSTLGGQMISKHLENSLGFTGGHGYSYYRSYGMDTPRKWQEFRQLLLANSSPENDDVIVASATETFSSLHDWFVLQPARS